MKIFSCLFLIIFLIPYSYSDERSNDSKNALKCEYLFPGYFNDSSISFSFDSNDLIKTPSWNIKNKLPFEIKDAVKVGYDNLINYVNNPEEYDFVDITFYNTYYEPQSNENKWIYCITFCIRNDIIEGVILPNKISLYYFFNKKLISKKKISSREKVVVYHDPQESVSYNQSTFKQVTILNGNSIKSPGAPYNQLMYDCKMLDELCYNKMIKAGEWDPLDEGFPISFEKCDSIARKHLAKYSDIDPTKYRLANIGVSLLIRDLNNNLVNYWIFTLTYDNFILDKSITFNLLVDGEIIYTSKELGPSGVVLPARTKEMKEKEANQ